MGRMWVSSPGQRQPAHAPGEQARFPRTRPQLGGGREVQEGAVLEPWRQASSVLPTKAAASAGLVFPCVYLGQRPSPGPTCCLSRLRPCRGRPGLEGCLPDGETGSRHPPPPRYYPECSAGPPATYKSLTVNSKGQDDRTLQKGWGPHPLGLNPGCVV